MHLWNSSRHRLRQVRICKQNFEWTSTAFSPIFDRVQMEEPLASTQSIHDQPSSTRSDAKHFPQTISQQTIDEIKHRFSKAQSLDEEVRQKSPALLSLELHIGVLFARTQVSLQLQRFEKASHLLDEAIQIAKAIGDRQLKGRCDFWVGMFCSEEGDRSAAAENFLKAVEIVGTDSPEAREEAKMLQRHMAYIKLLLEREAGSEAEAQGTIKLLEAAIAEFVSEEERKALSPYSVGKSTINWPSNMSSSRAQSDQSFLQGSAWGGPSPPSRRSASLDLHSVSAIKPSRIPRPVSMLTDTTTRSFIPIDRFLEDIRNPSHNIDSINRMLKIQRRPVDRVRTVRRSLIERLKLEESFQWPSRSPQSPQSPRRETGKSPEDPKLPTSPGEAQLSDTLAPEELDKRVEATIGRRKSIGLATTDPENSTVLQNRGGVSPISPTRRQSTDPAISSPLRRASLPGNEGGTEGDEG